MLLISDEAFCPVLFAAVAVNLHANKQLSELNGQAVFMWTCEAKINDYLVEEKKSTMRRRQHF